MQYDVRYMDLPNCRWEPAYKTVARWALRQSLADHDAISIVDALQEPVLTHAPDGRPCFIRRRTTPPADAGGER